MDPLIGRGRRENGTPGVHDAAHRPTGRSLGHQLRSSASSSASPDSGTRTSRRQSCPAPGRNSRRQSCPAGRTRLPAAISSGWRSVGPRAFNHDHRAPKARAEILPGLKARRVQTTPSPDRSPGPARQPALAPGLSLVPHGCGDPLIRLVQEPQLNRVLEGWCAICTRQKPPRAFERPGARAGCRAGPGDRSPKSPPASRARVFPKRGLARL
jgi:hypothetical protein